MKLKFYFFVMLIISSVMLSGSLFALDNNAEESLARGKRLFADGRYEEAMDNFINVFVSGNTDQIAEANEYVNLIHFDRGGVVAPKQVPYDEEIDKRQNLGTRGKVLQSKSSQKQVTVQSGNGEPLKEVFIKEEKETIAEPPSSVPEADPFGSQKNVRNSYSQPEPEDEIFRETSSEISEEMFDEYEGRLPSKVFKERRNEALEEMPGEMLEEGYDEALDEMPNEMVGERYNETLDEMPNEMIGERYNEALDEMPDEMFEDIADTSEGIPAGAVSPEEEEFIVLEGSAEVERGRNIISNETDSSFPKGSESKIRSLQRKEEQQKRQELIDYLVTKLNADEDVQVYMRNGHVDAIDINSSALFLGRIMDKVSSPILDDVYALMILENSPSYVILPEGSYTDDVTLHGVRQAVALNTYLINRGISPSKMTLNMGLTTQEPPEKFSDLAGISVVFDYDGKSHLKSKLQEKDLPPVLSLAVYPFNEITPSLGEVFVIDFSVMEASSPVKEWVLQIVSHAADKHYYVVKQLSGNNPLNYQTFWNGRKRYFGHLLPSGKYTIVLKARDASGRERILKRQVILKEGPTNEDDIVIKTESEVVREEEFKKIKEEQEAQLQDGYWGTSDERKSNLDYSQKRLWNKPSKRQVGNIEEETVQSSSVITTQSQNTVYQSSEMSSSSNITQGQETTEESNSQDTISDSYMEISSEEESNPYEI